MWLEQSEGSGAGRVSGHDMQILVNQRRASRGFGLFGLHWVFLLLAGFF